MTTTQKPVDLDERELKAIHMCVEYAKDPFGAPNHLLMVVIAKLWKRLEELLALWEKIDPAFPPEPAEADHD